MNAPLWSVLAGGATLLDGKGITRHILTRAAALSPLRDQVVALLADNSPDWLIADRALRSAGATVLPLPTFFTDAQCRHAIEAAGAAHMLVDDERRAAALGFTPQAQVDAGPLRVFRGDVPPRELPPGTVKITFTSGTTGQPKGVCLTTDTLQAVSGSLATLVRELGIRRHLCMLPLAVLLENVAGADTAALTGAECVVPPLADVGMAGSSQFDPRVALSAIARWRPDSLILLPQMLTALVAVAEAGVPVPRGLKLVAVGGARVAPGLIERARALGFPACEGYGLSEAGSVVALNRPSDAPGAVGRVLPHLTVSLSARNEIRVHGLRPPGYLGAPPLPDGPLHTGDLGHLDAQGRLHVTGRLKHQIITSFGRNVSPEWPESELLAEAAIGQVAVFGEARPTLSAVIVARPGVDDVQLDLAVRRANGRLPDYARIGVHVRAGQPFSAGNGLATDNGRVRRDAVWAHYGDRIASLYAALDGAPTLTTET